MTSAYNYLYKTIFVPLAGDLNGSLLFAITHVIGFWLILYWMYRKKFKLSYEDAYFHNAIIWFP